MTKLPDAAPEPSKRDAREDPMAGTEKAQPK
jgi:hypothetical protein